MVNKLGKSKYQQKAQKSLNDQKQNKGRPHYYDENIKQKKKNSGLVVFAIFTILIVGGVFIGGSLLNNVPDEISENPYYIPPTDPNLNEGGSDGAYLTDISITTLSGQVINLADHAGKVIVLYFFFIDCPACSTHSPQLQAASANFNSSELLIIAIDVMASDTPSAINNWASEGGYGFKLVKDTDYSLSSRFGAQYTPHTVYLGPDGDSSTRHTGAESAATITERINSLLA